MLLDRANQDLKLCLLNPIKKIKFKINSMNFNGFCFFVYFEMLYHQLTIFYPQGDPLGAPLVAKTNYMINFNNLLITRPILDPKVSRAG